MKKVLGVFLVALIFGVSGVMAQNNAQSQSQSSSAIVSDIKAAVQKASDYSTSAHAKFDQIGGNNSDVEMKATLNWYQTRLGVLQSNVEATEKKFGDLVKQNASVRVILDARAQAQAALNRYDKCLESLKEWSNSPDKNPSGNSALANTP
jgi:hypothetical protein